jgi:hypothetical protein
VIAATPASRGIQRRVLIAAVPAIFAAVLVI